MPIQVCKFNTKTRKRSDRHGFKESEILDIVECQNMLQKEVSFDDAAFNVIILTEYV